MINDTRYTAIPTRYAGHDFRSRAEARVCVILEELGLTYKFEEDYKDIGHGIRYLPDFCIKDVNIEMKDGSFERKTLFLEVKGNKKVQDIAKWRRFYDENRPLLIVGATLPDPNDYEMAIVDQYLNSDYDFYSYKYITGECEPAFLFLINRTLHICRSRNADKLSEDQNAIKDAISIAMMSQFETSKPSCCFLEL